MTSMLHSTEPVVIELSLLEREALSYLAHREGLSEAEVIGRYLRAAINGLPHRSRRGADAAMGLLRFGDYDGAIQ